MASSLLSRSSGLNCRPGQGDYELAKLPHSRINTDGPTVLLRNYIVAERQPKARSFARRLRGEERVEYSPAHLVGNSSAVITDAYLNPVVEVSRADCHLRLIGRVVTVVTP